MADDEFDIDIYGDANPEDTPFKKDEEGDVKIDGVDEAVNGHADNTNGLKHEEEQDDIDDDYVDIKVTKDDNDRKMDEQQKIKSTDESGADLLKIPKQAPQQQGVKRKEGSDDRPIDPGATTALLISELHWWNTDDDVRGWVNQAQVEDELKEITFSEHKVNGKSKGYVSVIASKLQRTNPLIVKLMSSLLPNKQLLPQSTRSMPLERDSNTQRNIRSHTQTPILTPSEHCQKMLHLVLKREAKAIADSLETTTRGETRMAISEETSEDELLVTTLVVA